MEANMKRNILRYTALLVSILIFVYVAVWPKPNYYLQGEDQAKVILAVLSGLSKNGYTMSCASYNNKNFLGATGLGVVDKWMFKRGYFGELSRAGYRFVLDSGEFKKNIMPWEFGKVVESCPPPRLQPNTNS
jgi:hypothetical protein